jgi:hypothetical protein
VTLTPAGNEFTDAGLTLQLPVPEISEQVRFTVPAKKLIALTVMEPLVVVLPAFTVGKGRGSVRTKSAVVETFTVKEVFSGDGAPEVFA